MKRLLLTSAGFQNPEFAQLFLKEAGTPAEKIKALFIPTAADVDENAKAMLVKCYEDLTNCGILPGNITIYGLNRKIDEAEISSYNAIYVCGGCPEYLLERMNNIGFPEILETAFRHNVIYIGVSAGSIVCGSNLKHNLGFLNKNIGVHCNWGYIGAERIDLTDDQAVWIKGRNISVLPENDFTADSRCGLHCTGCEYKITCGCGGCIETNGHPFHGECPVAVCCQNKGFVHCGECPDIPCELLMNYSCDAEQGDSPKGARINQCIKWARSTGMI